MLHIANDTYLGYHRPPPGLTLRQRVEQGEHKKGLRCDDVSCRLGPSDNEPEPTVGLARVVVNSLGDSMSVWTHIPPSMPSEHEACRENGALIMKASASAQVDWSK